MAITVTVDLIGEDLRILGKAHVKFTRNSDGDVVMLIQDYVGDGSNTREIKFEGVDWERMTDTV